MCYGIGAYGDGFAVSENQTVFENRTGKLSLGLLGCVFESGFKKGPSENQRNLSVRLALAWIFR